MTKPPIEVTSWADLDHLALALGHVGAQVDDTVRYAVHWMCRPDGFATSPVCVLQPLAEVMHLVAEAFTEAGRRYVDDWDRVRDAVAHAHRELLGGDARVATGLSALRPEVA